MGNCSLGCCPPNSHSPPPPPPPDRSSELQISPPLPPPPDRSSELQISDYKQLFGNINDATQLNPLIHHIEQLLSRIKAGQAAQNTKADSITMHDFVKDNVGGASKLLEDISTKGEALHMGNFASSLHEEMEKVISRALEGLGKLHWIAVGFSCIAFALERIQQVSSNFNKCLELLDTMFHLVKRLQEQYRRMPNEIENLNKMVLHIVEGVITCCSCMTQGKLFKYLFASTNDENLRRIESVIAKVHRDLSLMIAMDVQGRARDIQEQMPRRYYVSQHKAPVDAVGIDNRVTEVVKLLNVGGKEQRRAVILYGFGGVGKTTLADCALSKLDFGGLKYSRIQLDDKQSDVKCCQGALWADLTKERLQFKDCWEGGQKLQEVLQKESTFIFIDNALRKDQINDLLPSDLSLPAESRTPLTSRDIHVADELRMRSINCEEYAVKDLPRDAAKDFFKKTCPQM